MIESSSENHKAKPSARLTWGDYGRAGFYNLTFLIFSVFYLPFFVRRLRQAENWKQLIRERCGIFPSSWKNQFQDKIVLWLHAVSVGEVMAVESFVRKITQIHPRIHVVLTTVTPTGQRVAKKMEGKNVSVCYFPFDWSFVVRRFLKVLRPYAIFLVETEIWPNLLMQAYRTGISVGVLNGRLSERSRRRYQGIAFLSGGLFRPLDFVLAQSEDDRDRYLELGVNPTKIFVLGNMKYDNVSLLNEDQFDEMRSQVRRKWDLSSGDLLWVAGSTHPGEEEGLLEIYQKLRKVHPSLKMILAPRHIERSQVIEKLIRRKALAVRKASDGHSSKSYNILLLNQLGVLKDLYVAADVVFVGGSLVRRGGQNPIEPASVCRAIIHGPHTFNFQKVYQIFDQEGGALLIHNQNQLEQALKDLLFDASKRKALGARAYKIVQDWQGATQRHVEWLSDYLRLTSQERECHEPEYSKLFSSDRGGL